jgi:hypothetical protein
MTDYRKDTTDKHPLFSGDAEQFAADKGIKLPDAIKREFKGEIEAAVASAGKVCSIDPDELRAYAVERVYTYTVDAKSFVEGSVLTVNDIDPSTHRKVNVCLFRDMIDIVRADFRTRGLDDTVDELPEEIHMPSTDNLAERDSAMSDELESGFPTLMLHYVSGLSLREIATDLSVGLTTVVHRLDSEKVRFMKWALESGRVTEHDVVQVLFYGATEPLTKAL